MDAPLTPLKLKELFNTELSVSELQPAASYTTQQRRASHWLRHAKRHLLAWIAMRVACIAAPFENQSTALDEPHCDNAGQQYPRIDGH